MSEAPPFFAIKKIIFIQAWVVACVPALIFVLFGWSEARSALCGGLVAFVPNAHFAYKIVRSKGKVAKRVVQTFYRGEFFKILLTALMFAFMFQLPGILFFPLFVGFIAVLTVFWFALLMQ